MTEMNLKRTEAARDILAGRADDWGLLGSIALLATRLGVTNEDMVLIIDHGLFQNYRHYMHAEKHVVIAERNL